MKRLIDDTLDALAESGNLRRIPDGCAGNGLIDFTSNDYLGLSAMADLQREFLAGLRDESDWLLGASASRLLAARQKAFADLEATLESAYGAGRRALVFNSGYHANTGLVPALAPKGTFIVADRLVHASIIDGIRLSGAPFARFRHNDVDHARTLAAKAAADGMRVLLIIESVYSMDGDRADIAAFAAVREAVPDLTLYVDEAHAIGTEGPAGLGLASQSGADVDVIVGTFGKALASAGAFAIVSPAMREYFVNTARSLIFSTALPPLSAMWSRRAFELSLGMVSRRSHLKALGRRLSDWLGTDTDSHIQAFMVGDPKKAVALSQELRRRGLQVLPIRTPTVPPGTERLRLSLSAAMTEADIDKLGHALKELK